MRPKMMMNCCLASTAAMTLVIATLPAMAYTGQELSKQAKVSITEARAIALKAHPGKITDEELEKEKGGTGLRYSFDIKRGAVSQEVGVDAKTGKVLENNKEGPHPNKQPWRFVLAGVFPPIRSIRMTEKAARDSGPNRRVNGTEPPALP